MSVSPSFAVTNTRLPLTMGEDRPKGTTAFQTTFLEGPNSTGRPLEESIPDPLGPRNRGQSAPERAAIKRSPVTNMRIDGNNITAGESGARYLFGFPASR